VLKFLYRFGGYDPELLQFMYLIWGFSFINTIYILLLNIFILKNKSNMKKRSKFTIKNVKKDSKFNVKKKPKVIFTAHSGSTAIYLTIFVSVLFIIVAFISI